MEVFVRELLFQIVNYIPEEARQIDVTQLQMRIGRFQLRESKKVPGQQVEAPRMTFHDSENSGEFLARRFGAIEQSLDIPAQDREWRAQLVRNVRHEIAPDLIHFFQLSDVVKQNQCAGDFAPVVLCRDAMQLDLRCVQSQLAANRTVATERIGQQPIECGITDNLQQRRCYRNFGSVEQFSKRLIGQNHLPVG